MIKKSTKIVIGLFLIILGFVMGFVPFVPGVVFVVIGLEIAGLGFLFPKKFRSAWNDISGKLREMFSRKKKDNDINHQ